MRKNFLSMLCVGLILCGAARVQAQDATDDLSNQGSAQLAFNAVGAAAAKQGLNGDQTGDLYVKLITDHPKISPVSAVHTGAEACACYWGASDFTKLLDFSQSRWKAMNADPSGLVFLGYAMSALSGLDRAADAEKLGQDNWQIVTAHLDDGLGAFAAAEQCSALDAQGKQTEAAAQLRKIVLSHPLFLDANQQSVVRFPVGRFYSELVGDLISSGQGDEALAWAKLRFVECSFDESALTGANDQLVRAWVAKTLSQEAVKAFMAAQKDPTAVNPLADVKLPVFDDESKKALMSAANKPAFSNHDRISALIALGEFGEAMNLAKLTLVEQIGTPAGVTAGVGEVCRVFKAADLNVVHANDFAQFFQSGKGTNPVDDFMKQHPVGAVAP